MLLKIYKNRYPCADGFAERIVASKLAGNRHLDDYACDKRMYLKWKYIRYIDSAEIGLVVSVGSNGVIYAEFKQKNMDGKHRKSAKPIFVCEHDQFVVVHNAK